MALKALKNMPVLRAVQMLFKEIEIRRHLNHENVVKVEKFIKIYDNASGFPKLIFVYSWNYCDGCLDRMIWKAWTLSEDKTRE
jgi:hypothetical protein